MAKSNTCKTEDCNAVGAGKDGLCNACRAVKEGEYENRTEYYRAIASKGGKESAKYRTKKGVEADELPPLTDHAAAEVWLDVVGRAVVVGRLDNRDAQAAIRAVDTFLKARAEKEQSERIGQLRERMEELQAQLEDQNDRPWE